MNVKKIFPLLFLLSLLLVSFLFFTLSWAGALTDSYDQLALQFPEYISRLEAGGASEEQIRAFVNDLDTILRGQNLNKNNFQNALLSAALTLATREQHKNVVNAIGSAFGSDISEILKGHIPPSLQPLYSVLEEKLLGGAQGPPPPGGGGGGFSQTPPLTQEDKETKKISANAGGAVSFSGAAVEIPAGALPADATISVKKLSPTEASNIVPSGWRLKLASDVYEITTTGSRSFNKEITICLAFDPSKVVAKEQAIAHYFDGTNWIQLDGIVEDRIVVVKINHLTSFAVFSTKVEAPSPPPIKKTFADLANHWAKQDVETMLAKGLVAGVSATEFAPERTVTRAEFAALVVRALGIEYAPALRSHFTDVKEDSWYAAAVAAAVNNGLVSGYRAASFGPEDVITREQMAAMVVRALSKAGKDTALTKAEVNAQLGRFSDEPLISAWARESTVIAVAKGIMKGRTATTIVPQGTATRAEAAVMALRMYGHIQGD